MKNVIAILILLFAASIHAQTQKIGDNLYVSSARTELPCHPEIRFDPNIHENSQMSMLDVYPEFIWPMEDGIDTGIVLVNYVDNLPGSGIKDYMGNEWSYNGHNGTDISLHNFREMDRFYLVKAAAPGTVVQIAYSNYDRDTACITDANIVLIRHDDGSYAYYFHLMKNSITVRVGEYVPVGRTIGYAGSSGCSSDAHLHFEPGRFINNQWSKRDPWNGTYNNLPSLWQDQFGYVRNRNIKVHNMGVFTEGLVGGNMNNVSPALLKQGVLQPNTVSGYESKIGMFILLQGRYTGTPCYIEIRKPNGNLFDDTYFYINDYYQYAWIWWTPDFNPGIAETGNWYVRVLYNGVEQMRDYFDVQLLTSNRPRLYPVAGKCFRRTALTQRDTLRVRPVRANMQYDLLNAPSNVTITNDSILNISPSFTQAFRVREFKVIASIGGNATLRDTLIYKLIDTTENHPSGNGVVSLDMTALIEGRWGGSYMQPDTAKALLRAPITPYGILDSSKIVLNSKGFGIANFINASGGIYYYVVLKHRNSIETWTKNVQLLDLGQPNTYNFTTSSNQAYGNNLKFSDSKWCIYSGDVNQDATIDLSDILDTYNYSNLFFQSTYSVYDVNGDEFTDLTDIIIVFNNSSNFVSRIRP